MSDLHKQNLADVLGVQIPDSESPPSSSQYLSTAYRDRAKERRMKFGTDDFKTSNSLKVYILSKQFQ